MKSVFEKIHPIAPDILEEYIKLWDTLEVPARASIIREGQTQKHLLFVTEGIQRIYFINEGKEHVLFFTYPPSFSLVPESFICQSPSKLFLDTITYSKFLRISYTDHYNMTMKYREIETFSRKATEIMFIGMINRHYELLAFDIEKRFKLFAKRSSHLFNTVPHKYLASYLRIDPTNFSKLINNVKI
jgi:CRP-like cAMP-binding protein